jgi:RimJ/RimL family protein N-acetyltransferase
MENCKILTPNHKILIPNILNILNKGFNDIEEFYDCDCVGKARQKYNQQYLRENMGQGNERFIGHFTMNNLDGLLVEKKDNTYDDVNNISWLFTKNRGKGIGSNLVNDCIKRTINSGQKYISLGVSKNNLGAIKFYEKMGFKFDSEYDDGHMFLYYKDLNEGKGRD